MATNPASLSDIDFFYAYLPEFLDEELAGESKSRFDRILASDPKYKDVPAQFKSMRGKFQLALQSYYLQEHELMKLHALVQDPNIRHTEEAQRIADLERGERLGTFWRRLVLAGIVIAIVFGIVYVATPHREKKFDALEYLGYETVAMDEDPEGRLDVPTNDINEIREFLGKSPNLEFRPVVLKPFGGGWEPEGAAVIDYEIKKVAMVKYSNKELKETMYHFSLLGSIKDLPKTEEGSKADGAFKFQTYASDQLNIIAWQQDSETLCFLIGRRSAVDLSAYAYSGTKL